MRKVLTLLAFLSATVPALAADDYPPSDYSHVTNQQRAIKVSATPTVQAAAYASGNCMGGFNAVTIASSDGQSILLNSVALYNLDGATTTITVYLFDASPAASTCTDKSTFTLATADVTKLVAAPFGLIAAVPTGTTRSGAENANMGRLFQVGGSATSGVKTFYYALVSGGTFTPGSTTNTSLVFEAEQLN